MKNKILILFAFVFSMISFSCETDYLDASPTASIDAGAAYSTTKNASAAINGIYRSFVVRYLSSQGHSGHPAMMIILDHLGEDLVLGTTAANWHVNETRWVAHRTDVNVLTQFPYEMYYRFIGNANIGIANIDKYGKRYDGVAKPNGQLGIPLVLEPTTEGKARNTVEEVYTQINKDLDAAAALLTSARANKSHINLNVVKGLQARVALVQQNWAGAAKFAAEARAGYLPMSAAQYADGFQDISNPEWMWGFDHLEDQTEYFGGYHSYISCNYNSTVIRTVPKAINSLLYNQISPTDVRANMWVRTPTASNSIVPPGGVRVPFINQKFRLPGVPSTSAMGDVPYMRAAEMYLIEAEAKVRLGDNAGAATVLNSLIRTRDANYVTSTKTGTALLDEILLHRRIELWGEGHRFLDLKRMNAPLNRNGANHIASVVLLYDVAPGDVRWEFLIPRREINANTAIVQNPL